MATNNTSMLQSLLSGEIVPNLPAVNPRWTLPEYQREMELWHRKLLEYIRKLLQKVTEANLLTVVNQYFSSLGGGVVDWRYHASTNTFQVKRIQDDGSLGDWEDTAADQPTTATITGDWQYDTTVHKFQQKTRQLFVLKADAASSFGNTSGGQPVSMTKVIRDVSYSTSTHLIEQDTTADVYMLEKGADTNDVDITEAVPCVS